MEDDLRRRARALVDDIEPGRPIDFVERIAAELPMQVICILLGVPEEDRHQLFEAVEPAFDFPEGDSGAAWPRPRRHDCARRRAHRREAGATRRRHALGRRARLARRRRPAQLTELELYSFFSLLFAAGSGPPATPSPAACRLLERPDQLAQLRADPALLPSAVEEMLRWTTPSPAKRRTATCATVLGGQAIEPGDKVLFWEGSANRDEAVFDRSMEFDIRRDPNPHLAFGHGVHHCLGASLARLEIRVLFEELLPRFGCCELVQPAEWTRSNRHTGLRHLPFAFTST